MDFDTFLGAVQNRARLDSTEAALRVSRCTLTTLSERIQPGEADDLAAQLPDEIGRFLTEVDAVESFDYRTFVDRVVDCGSYDEDDRADAVFHARVVVSVVTEAVTGGELADVRDQLPEDENWDELFEFGEPQSPED